MDACTEYSEDSTASGEIEPFTGEGFCFVELGASSAARIDGACYVRPQPEVVLTGESEQNAEAKRRFETERLERWFGA